ncbi:MAG: hypothetical protein ACOC2H_05290 [Spirochaetota bacterium]
MSVMIGPGFISIGIMMLLRILHDRVRLRSEKPIERHTKIAGRITGYVTGTFAIEMILRGIQPWLPKLCR